MIVDTSTVDEVRARLNRERDRKADALKGRRDLESGQGTKKSMRALMARAANRAMASRPPEKR